MERRYQRVNQNLGIWTTEKESTEKVEFHDRQPSDLRGRYIDKQAGRQAGR